MSLGIPSATLKPLASGYQEHKAQLARREAYDSKGKRQAVPAAWGKP